MKSLLVGLLVLGMAIPSFAGANIEEANVETFVPEAGITEGEVVNLINRGISEHTSRDHKVSTVKANDNGFAIGFYDNQVALKLPELFWVNTEIGGTVAGVDTGFAKAWVNLFGLPIGVTSFMTENASSTTGLFVGLEKHLEPNLSIYVDVYPVVVADPNSTYGLALFGGRLYF